MAGFNPGMQGPDKAQLIAQLKASIQAGELMIGIYTKRLRGYEVIKDAIPQADDRDAIAISTFWSDIPPDAAQMVVQSYIDHLNADIDNMSHAVRQNKEALQHLESPIIGAQGFRPSGSN